ncbi:uncharacterized protein LOC117170258 [Belonocnema kinseyi]|uniref:uncharacterized protein LOC117170258 n=1 Tax=Belonocnema kinseyi TaxID=2817044 RepID=UPI00143DBE83|nr:uncharacterized protein LOC117170258 [Belonocnema kinseyi]
MNIFIQLFVCVVSLNINMSDAVFKEWFNEWFNIPPNDNNNNNNSINNDFDVRIGDFVSVYIFDPQDEIHGTGVFIGNIDGRIESADLPARGAINHCLFVRLPSGVVFYANLIKRLDNPYANGWPCRYFIEGREDTFFSNLLTPNKPSDSRVRSILLQKYKHGHTNVFYMWAEIGHYTRNLVPKWANRAYWFAPHTA